MRRIVLLGAGNVGSHLAEGIAHLEGYTLYHHYSRRAGGRLEELPQDADLYLFALSDDALPTVWEAMPETSGVWMHTAGSVPLSALARYHERTGVLYPLQTFSTGRRIEWADVPIYYEGDEEARCLAEALSRHTAYASSEGRAKLHLSAVLAANYSNYLIGLAEDYLTEASFDPKALLPLLKEMVLKLETLPAREAQTGPAVRGDRAVIDRHLSMLSGHTRETYAFLAHQILERYGKIS